MILSWLIGMALLFSGCVLGDSMMIVASGLYEVAGALFSIVLENKKKGE